SGGVRGVTVLRLVRGCCWLTVRPSRSRRSSSGDRVVATDPDTGESEPQKVVATIVGHGQKDLVEITVDVDGEAGDAVSTITATAEHPFWVDDHGRLLQPAAHGPWGEAPGWYDAADLDPGDQLRTPTGDKVRVADIRAYTTTTTVHNLTINGVHTYHVQAGGTAVLTHNDNCELPKGYTLSPALKGDPYRPDTN